VVRAGDTVPLAVGQNLTIDELRGLRFLAAAGSTATSDQFAFTAVESGGTPLSSSYTLPLDVVHRSPLSFLGDLEPTVDSSDPASFATLGGIAYFSATDPLHGLELWRSDGTTAGTWLVKDIQPGTRGSSISGLTAGSSSSPPTTA
jgi:ELWxxDGT repeat protein